MNKINKNYSELEELLTNSSNDTTIDIGNLLNLPDILDIQGTSTEAQTPEAQTPGCTHTRPDSPWRPRYPCRPHSPWKTYPLVKDTILYPIHQETPSPDLVGYYIPRSKEPLIPWEGFGTKEGLTECLDDVFDENGEC